MFIWTLPQSPCGGIYLSFAAGIPYTTKTAIQTIPEFHRAGAGLDSEARATMLASFGKLEFRKKIGWLDRSVDS
jgi:hypothetical protein